MIKATRGKGGVCVALDGTLAEIIAEVAAITMQVAMITEGSGGKISLTQHISFLETESGA